MSSVHVAMVTILECWKMHTGWVFAARGNHQCCSLPSDAPEALSSTAWKMSGEEDDHPTIWQCKAPHCSCVYWEDSEEWLGCSPHPPYSLDLAPLDYHLFKIVKYRMCNQWHSLGSHLLSFANCCYLTDVVLSYSYPYVTMKLCVHDFWYSPHYFWHVRCL